MMGRISVNDACRVRALIAERADRDEPARENVQAREWAGHTVAEVLGLDMTKKADKARVVAMLRKWIETKVLLVERMAHGSKKREADFIFPGPNNPAEVDA